MGADGNEQDKVYLDGTGVPKWELSWGNTFRYKDFDLSLFFRGRFRYKVMNQYEMYYGRKWFPAITSYLPLMKKMLISKVRK